MNINNIQTDLQFLFGPRTVNKLREVYFKKNLPIYHILIIEYTKNYDMKFNQRVWHFYHQIEHPPQTNCMHCNKILYLGFRSFKDGYPSRKFCNSKCQLLSDDYKEKMKSVYLEKYGYENHNSVPEIIQKKKDSYFDKTGYKHWAQDPLVKDKKRNTCIERYGVSYALQDERVKNKIKSTLLERYGVDNSMKHYPSFKLNMANGFKIKTYKETKLLYQSKLELKFIELYDQHFDLNNLSQDLIITYHFDNANKKYYPDFYIESINTIIEIKSDWTYDKYGTDEYTRNKNISKEQKCKELGYNYIMLKGESQIYDYIQELLLNGNRNFNSR